MSAEILTLESADGVAAAVGGSRPLLVNQKTGQVQIATQRGLRVNSLLGRNEWIELDNSVLDAARATMRAVSDLRTRGLRYELGSMASVASRWYTASEVSGANINMSGRGGANRDLPELIQKDVPVPIIFKDFEVDTRALMASRRMGDGLDVTAARAATQVVVEAMENLTIGNLATFKLNGIPLYGYRNHPNRNTATAAGLGGGVWTTIGNIEPTVVGMIGMANADYHYGPFMLYASTNQFNYAALKTFTDGSGDTPRTRILRMPQMVGFEMLPLLPDGELLLVQMDANTVDFAEPADMMGIQVREWSTDDGLSSMFKVMSIFAPRVKARQDTRSGVQHVTGA